MWLIKRKDPSPVLSSPAMPLPFPSLQKQQKTVAKNLQNAMRWWGETRGGRVASL